MAIWSDPDPDFADYPQSARDAWATPAGKSNWNPAGGYQYSTDAYATNYGPQGTYAAPSGAQYTPDANAVAHAAAVKADAARKKQSEQNVADYDSGANRIYNDAMYRGMRGDGINKLVEIGRDLASRGKLAYPASATAADIMKAYNIEQRTDPNTQGGFLHDILNPKGTYGDLGGYAGLQTLYRTDPTLLDQLVSKAEELKVGLGNIPGLFARDAGRATLGDKWDLLKSGEYGKAAKAHFRDPLSYLPMPVQAVVGLGNAFGQTIGTYIDPRTGISMAVGADGNPYPFDVGFRNPQPEGGDNTTPLINQVSPVTTAFQGAPGFNRSTALDQLIESTIGGTVNPGIEDDYFNRIIKEGILGRNFDLGADATQQQFEGTFASSRLGEELLGAESGRLRDVSRGQIGDVFTGKAFEPITDDAAIDKILSEKQASAFGDIARFGARGNLSTTGGATAGQFISGREPQARSRLEEIGTSIRESGQSDIDVIRGRAEQAAEGFNLGDPFFDIAPFTAEREAAIQGRLPSIESDIRLQLGAERLFDTQSAIREGAKSQGLVSGAPSFLDELAARSGQRSQRDRGIGSIGSGVF
jgi:hypothetical protein